MSGWDPSRLTVYIDGKYVSGAEATVHDLITAGSMLPMPSMLRRTKPASSAIGARSS